MSRPRRESNPDNASIQDLKVAGKYGSYETSTRCTAIQLLMIGVRREQVCAALEVGESSLRKRITYRKAAALDPKDENLIYNMVRVYYEQGALDDCLAQIDQILKIRPDHREAQKLKKTVETKNTGA